MQQRAYGVMGNIKLFYRKFNSFSSGEKNQKIVKISRS